MPNLYIIAGCNGAGKTTASFTILPEMLNCREFVNADEIARGISPFQPGKVSIEAGKIMLERINFLISENSDFAFETTLAARSYFQTIDKALRRGYFITLIFFWLNQPELAIERVRTRVLAGGHHIDNEIIVRRYYSGLKNFFNLYMSKCDYWLFVDNSDNPFQLVAEGKRKKKIVINDIPIWNELSNRYHENN